jgi:hypothetical protein
VLSSDRVFAESQILLLYPRVLHTLFMYFALAKILDNVLFDVKLLAHLSLDDFKFAKLS